MNHKCVMYYAKGESDQRVTMQGSTKDSPFTTTYDIHADYWFVNVSQLPLQFKQSTRSKINRF